jgi:hypothetical protein
MLILEAVEQSRFWSERRRKPVGDAATEDQFRANLLTRLREFVENRKSGNDNTILQLDLTRWPGRQVAPHLLTVFGPQFTDPLAREFFKRNTAALVLRWTTDQNRRHSRVEKPGDEQELDAQVEHLYVDPLVQFTLNQPAQEANEILEPVFSASSHLPEKAAEVVKWLVIRQGEQTPATTFWMLWQRFADGYLASSLPASADNEHSNSAKLLRELFLGDNWGEARDWNPLHGEEQRMRGLFDRMPASQKGFEVYTYFLEKIGSPTLPDALISLAAKMPTTGGATLFSEITVFYLETILTRLIYGGNRRIRVETDLRQATMKLLDELVAAGSSVAYKLRDDFLTPM